VTGPQSQQCTSAVAKAREEKTKQKKITGICHR